MQDVGEDCLAESLLAVARRNLPVIDRALAAQGDETLGSYVTGLVEGPRRGYQAMDDLLDWLRAALAPLLGEAAAHDAVHDLGSSPTVLTASHHGVDSSSQSFQGNLLFAVNRWLRAGAQRTIWVFSCGNIPLNNSGYPRGLLFYRLCPESVCLTMKFPIFPDRLKRSMVSVVCALDSQMITRAELQLARMIRLGEIPMRLAAPLHQLLREDYGEPFILSLPTYSEQSLLLNRRIWKKLFAGAAGSHRVVYFELEKAVSAMLMRDLMSAESLMGSVLFDPKLRENVLCELDGRRGCWHLEKLARDLNLSCHERRRLKGFGTVFFWGVDEHNRRVPLCLKSDGEKGEVLFGLDDQGRTFQVAFTPKALLDALQNRLLLPSLFTCFATLSFARGLVCIGGYFQAEYLPAMQQGLMRALAKTQGYESMTPMIGQVPTGKYLSGMQAVMVRADEGCLIPAGPLDIMAGGGISGGDVEQMLRLTVREALLAGLFETVPDGVPAERRPKGWEKQLARDCWVLLGDKVVVK